jgi:hypothetical protein
MAKGTIMGAQIQKLRDQLSGVATVLPQASGNAQGMLGAALFGNLGAKVIANSIQLVAGQINNVKSSIMDAAKAQTAGLAQAGDLSTQLGISFAKAKDLVASTRAEISKMAAALPGENAAYTAIFNNISATVAKTSKGDIEAFKRDSMELTKTFGVLASIRENVDPYSGGATVNRLLAGTMGLREAFGNNDITQKNPLLETYINEQLKIIGKSGDDWKKLTDQTRQQVLIAAGKKAISQETLNSFDGTVESMIQLATNTLFDQDIGIFGFLKKIQEAQGRSGLDAVQTSMQALVNLFKVLGRFTGALGLNQDTIMLGVIRTFDWFTDLTNTVTGVLNGGQIGDITKLFSDAWVSTIKIVNKVLDVFTQVLSRVPWGEVGNQFGQFLSKAMSDFVSNLDWGKLALGVMGFIKSSIEFQAGLVTGAINGFFQAITDKINGATRVVTDPIGSTVGSVVPQPLQGAAKFLGSLGADNLGGGVFGTLRRTGEALQPLNTPKPTKDANKQAFAPSVTVNGASGDPQAIAQNVIEAINNLYKDYQANSLA